MRPNPVHEDGIKIVERAPPDLPLAKYFRSLKNLHVPAKNRKDKGGVLYEHKQYQQRSPLAGQIMVPRKMMSSSHMDLARLFSPTNASDMPKPDL